MPMLPGHYALTRACKENKTSRNVNLGQAIDAQRMGRYSTGPS